MVVLKGQSTIDIFFPDPSELLTSQTIMVTVDIIIVIFVARKSSCGQRWGYNELFR